MKKILLSITVLFLYGCPNDDDISNLDNSCCGENPFESTNIDNLDQPNGEIVAELFITPNQDGFNDGFAFSNLRHYLDNHLIIYNSSDNIIYETDAFGAPENPYFPTDEDVKNGNIPPDGIYRYKLIVENEKTFFEQGYFCVITDLNTELDTSQCDPNDFDPIIR